MLSKESDYLIHLAEAQLERLNKSLYFYQRNAKIQENLLDLSVDSNTVEEDDVSLTPLYAIIDRQRRESLSNVVSRSSGDISCTQLPSKTIQRNLSLKHSNSFSINDSHTKDWRQTDKVVRRSAGPTSKESQHKYNFHQDLLSGGNKKPKSTSDIEKSEKGKNKCSDRQNSYSRNEIRKYIRDKQRLYKEKGSKSGKKERFSENMHSSLLKLNDAHYGDYGVMGGEKYDYFSNNGVKHQSVYRSATDVRRPTRSEIIYEEFRKEGKFQYPICKKKEYPIMHSSSIRHMKGFTSTVDSACETGERVYQPLILEVDLRKVKNEEFRSIKDVSPESFREQMRKEDSRKRYASPGANGGYFHKSQKQFQDQTLMYDASSENELRDDTEFSKPEPVQSISPKNKLFPSNPHSPLMKMSGDSDNYLKGNQKKSPTLDVSPSVTSLNHKSDFSSESSWKKSKDIKSKESCQLRLVEELKEALLEAQKHLNPEICEPFDTLSERISRAVENFVKTKDSRSELSDVANANIESEIHERSGMMENSIIVKPKSESLKKDHLSTEYEVTEIEHEKCKVGKIDPCSMVRLEIKEIVEDLNSLSMNNEESETIDDLLKQDLTSNIATRKKDLESRRDKANELIRLTQEFKKEAKRVRLLEKKACQFSKQYFLDPKDDTKMQESNVHYFNSIGLVKLPRHAIPPDGKDSGRSEIIENIKSQLSPRKMDLLLSKDLDKCDLFPRESFLQNQSETSDVDEPTVSISEVSTTLTDQSELEARLVALRAEMNKKHNLLSTLKIRQKELKRENIKQKEVTLQKQIEMYDSYISKLQINIDELNNKVEDVVNEDESRTLTGSTTTINELDSNVEEVEEKNIQTEDELQSHCEDEYSKEKHNSENNDLDQNKTTVEQDVDFFCNMPLDVSMKELEDTEMESIGYKIDFEKEQFQDMVRKNSCCDDLLKDLDLEYLFTKKHEDFDTRDENKVILDDTTHIPDQLYDPKNSFKSSEVVEKEKENDGKDVNEEIEPDKDGVDIIGVDKDARIFTQGSPSFSWESESVEDVHNIPVSNVTCHGDFEEINDKNLKFPVYDFEDDGSSISDVTSLKVADEDFTVYNDGKVTRLLQDTSVKVLDQEVTFNQTCTDDDPSIDPLNFAKVDLLVQHLLNDLLDDASKDLILENVQLQIEPSTLHSAVEIQDFESTSFMEAEVPNFPEHKEEKPTSSVVLRPGDMWEFSDIGMEEPSLIVNSSTAQNNVSQKEELVDKDADTLSMVDKEFIQEKIKWLIPLDPKHMDPYVDCAIMYIFNERQSNQKLIEQSVNWMDFQHLPQMFTDAHHSIVTEEEIAEALCSPSNQRCYIDKRTLLQLVKEVFAEVFSFQRYLPKMPWIHPSFMIKRNNYTTWGGDKPPESYDLVNKIVRERIFQLFNQKDILFQESLGKSRESCSHSKITKWCIQRQKDLVDKLLINDLRKEENEWVFYDEAEEEVKVQIAEDIFQLLINDATSWSLSALSQA